MIDLIRESSVHYVRRHAPVRPGPAANRRSSREISPPSSPARRPKASRSANCLTSPGAVRRTDFLSTSSAMRTKSALSSKLSADLLPDQKDYFVARDVAIDTLLLAYSRAGWREATSKLYVNPAVDTLIMRQIIEDYKPERRGSSQVQQHELLAAETDRGKGVGIPRPAHPRIAVGDLAPAR